MRLIVLAILLLIITSGFTIPDDPHVDVYRCECDDPIDNIRLCYCTRDGLDRGNCCEYFYWTRYEGVISLWHMCDGYGLLMPILWR